VQLNIAEEETVLKQSFCGSYC